MLPLSVIVCTHNPRPDYIGRVLRALENQTLALDEWELLLVDNASTEPLSGAIDLSWHPHARHIREMTVGAAWARLRGITEARAELLVFVDDDTVLEHDYLIRAKEIAADHPEVGAWSGGVRLEFEQPPPEWIKPYWNFLSHREVSSDTHSRSSLDSPSTPWGGGLCLRHEVGLFYAKQWRNFPTTYVLGPRGKSLGACEDTQLALTACDMGMEVGVFARLQLTHLIRPERLSERYFFRQVRNWTKSIWFLRFLRGKRLNRLPKGTKWWIKFLYDSARKRGRERRFYMAEVLGKRDAWRIFNGLGAGSGEGPGVVRPNGAPGEDEHALERNSTKAAGVIICTHNPRQDYLQRVLEALRGQSVPLSEWELLLVDNASSKPLSDLVDLTWHPNGRHIREMSLGLTQARLRGIVESKAELLVFVDDDNVLESNYLAHVLAISSEHPQLGAWSGNVRLEFDEPPPEWTKPYWRFLAERSVPADAWSCSTSDTPSTPFGAGMCVRRRVGVVYRNQLVESSMRRELDRKGHALTSGGDTDLALTACDLGLTAGVFARLELIHLIPTHRLTEDYLLRLCRGLAMSWMLLRLVRRAYPWGLPEGYKWWKRFIKDCAQKRGRERRFFIAENLGRRDALRAFRASSIYSRGH
jgi:glycosyltransferase involved in cell wall biosynthesis